ncbi:MAG: hypothetical protein PHO08_06245 [Methylococcales bacterium]|nr:hypothetical protein [Methylococcales bacterium]
MVTGQIDQQFGAQGSFLIDIYPVCDYLAAAAIACAPMNEKVWLDKQKELLKQNDYQSVLDGTL